MRYWWVNQNQTYRHEVRGGYLWSPKRNVNRGRNPFYDFMREVAPDDVVFSFADTWIKAIGFVVSHAYEAPKPLEFGEVGAYWENIGWRVDVRFTELRLPIRPVDHNGRAETSFAHALFASTINRGWTARHLPDPIAGYTGVLADRFDWQ